MSERIRSERYERFEQYLYKLRELALGIMDNLDDNDKRIIRGFFKRQYPSPREHYWSIKKLYCFAMFLPVFLQIGLSYFDKLIYIDTHAGPGLAKIGPEEDEFVPGSPLIALKWPEIIAETCKPFRKIQRGFDEYVLVDKDPQVHNILHRIINNVAKDKEVAVINSDSNHYLPSLAKRISKEQAKKRVLALLFVDPFGIIKSQLSYSALSSLLGGDCKVDVVMNIMSSMLARGLSYQLNSNYLKYKDTVRLLFNDLPSRVRGLSLFEYCLKKPSPKASISRDDVVQAYIHLFKSFRYQTIFCVPVEFREGQILYHLILASKSRGARRWLGNYVNYIESQLPQGYESLKAKWFKVSGKGLYKWLS
ncbi:MAG: hypothetical protein DRJ60_02270 [Thermoprotei archaeon]|nr:MAG: hypothetical protein DRJ60_02270 [Thermoprotei archaeon]